MLTSFLAVERGLRRSQDKQLAGGGEKWGSAEASSLTESKLSELGYPDLRFLE